MHISQIRLDALTVALNWLRARAGRNVAQNIIIMNSKALEAVWLSILDLGLANLTVAICFSGLAFSLMREGEKSQHG